MSKYVYLIKANGKYYFIDILSGSVIETSSSFIKNNKVKEFTVERNSIFKSLIENKEDFNTILSKAVESYKQIPNNFYIYTTFSCNLNCAYCFQDDAVKTVPSLNQKMLNKIFDSIQKIGIISGRSKLTIIGGEPLLPSPNNYRLLNSIIHFADRNGMKIKLETNGFYMLEFIEEMKTVPKAFEVIQVVIDGPKEVHDKRRQTKDGKGSFEKISEGISFALDKGFNIMLRINTDFRNIEFLNDLENYAGKKRWLQSDRFVMYVAPMRELSCNATYLGGSEIEILNKFLKMKGDGKLANTYFAGNFIYDTVMNYKIEGKLLPPQFVFCGANLNRYAFGPDGYIYACVVAVGKKQYAIGRYNPDYFINEKKLEVWRTSNLIKSKECNECAIAPLCGGGCTFQHLEFANDNCLYTSDEKNKMKTIFLKLVKEAIEDNYGYEK